MPGSWLLTSSILHHLHHTGFSTYATWSLIVRKKGELLMALAPGKCMVQQNKNFRKCVWRKNQGRLPRGGGICTDTWKMDPFFWHPHDTYYVTNYLTPLQKFWMTENKQTNKTLPIIPSPWANNFCEIPSSLCPQGRHMVSVAMDQIVFYKIPMLKLKSQVWYYLEMGSLGDKNWV